MDVTLAHPPGYNLIDRTVASAKSNAAKSGGKFEIVDDMDAAFKDADIVYPKSWGVYDLMLARQDAKTKEEIADNQKACLAKNAEFKNWICDEKRMKLAKTGGGLHALPAGGPRQRSDRRGDRRPAIDRLPRSRKPPAHRQSDHGLHDARAAVLKNLTG